MEKIFLLTLLICLPNFLTAYNAEEERTRDYLHGVNQRYRELNRQARDAFWKENPDLEYSTNYIIYIRNLTLETSNYLREGLKNPIQDSGLKQQVKNLRNIGTMALQNEDWLTFEHYLSDLKSVSTTKRMCPFESHHGRCNKAFFPHLFKVFTTSDNTDELKHYWTEFRDKVGPEAKGWLRDYVTYYKKSSELNEARTPSYQHYYKYDNPNFLIELEELLVPLRPLYGELHAYIRHFLNVKYGADVVKDNGPIPYHLLEKVILQNFKPDSFVTLPFPMRPLPDMNAALERNNYNGRTIVDTANQFYNSLGIANLPSSFWATYLKPLTTEEAGTDCKAQVFDFAPDVAMKYCPNLSFKQYVEIHGDMAAIYYTANRNIHAIGLNDEACPGFTKAIGHAAMLSASTFKHADRTRLIINFPYDSQYRLNRLFRMAIHTIFTIFENFVFEKLFVQILDGRISPADYNCIYWNMMDEWMGVDPPVPRTSKNFDVPYKFYEGIDPKHTHASEIFAEVLGYQMYKGFCIQARDYDLYYNTLDNCDFYGNLDVGTSLRKIMEKGSSKSWRDHVESITGNRRLNVDAIVEYYEPLRSWLEAQNRLNRVYPGWPVTRMCRKIETEGIPENCLPYV